MMVLFGVDRTLKLQCVKYLDVSKFCRQLRSFSLPLSILVHNPSYSGCRKNIF